MADVPKSLGINPFACTPPQLAQNFSNIIKEFTENGSRIIRFRLTANLSTGEDAAAVVLTCAGASYTVGDVVQVFDHYEITADGSSRGMWQGVTNDEGFAKVRETSVTTGRLEADIIWMEQYAREIEFTLTSTFTAGAATATVDASWGQGVAPASPLTVHDDQNNYSWAAIGDKGVASRSEYAAETSPQTPYYKVIELLPITTGEGGPPFTSGIVFYALTEDLEAGESADAVVIAGDAPNGTNITVDDRHGDHHRGMWEAPSGTTGWAKRRSTVTGTYDIIWQSPHARLIEFTLTEDPTFAAGGWSATATVNRSYIQGIDPGASITVYDTVNYHPQAKSGAKGAAWREEYYDGTGGAPRYIVHKCQQVALFGRAILAEDMCDAGPVDITDFTPMSPSPFNINILPTSAFNDLAHKGQSGDVVLLEWDEGQDAYVVHDVTKKKITVGKTYWNDGAKCLMTTKYEIAAEYCETFDDEEIICFTDCTEQQ